MAEPEHLQRLNPEQLSAVTTVEGPVLVLAGAGSGKTRVLTRRIAHLLSVGVAAQNVLAVTFTNKAASEMRERVSEMIGEEAAKRTWVSTFHSTCARILRMEIEALGFTRRFAIYDDDDQQRLMKSLVASAGYDSDRVDARDILSKIDSYKNRMLGPDEVLGERRSHVADPLVRLWRDYDEALRAADALDFNDLVGKTVELFQKHPTVLERWRDRFRFVLVDEYQDTNRGQYLLLRLLADGHRNLAVVGDDDQSIYGFRGADVTNILNFQQDYPEANVVRLEQNYRSTGNILALANAVVSHNPQRLEKRLWTQAPDGLKVQLIVAAGPREEAVRVADGIQRLRRMGIEPGQVAIIYRTNAAARFYEAALRGVRVPYRVVGGRKFYERREVRDLLAYLRLVVNPADDAAFLRVVNVPPRGVGPKTQAELRVEAGTRSRPLLATARARGVGRTAQEKGLTRFVEVVDSLTDLARDVPLEELVAEIITRTGYQQMLLGDVNAKGVVEPESQERIKNLQALVDDARVFDPSAPGAPIDRLVAWLDRIALTADADSVPDGGEVTLMTVHSAKGLEFPVVFVVQMNEGVFPHERSAETGAEEERRLAYVAFTRAMQRLIVTRSMVDLFGSATQPSRFLYGVPTELFDGDLPTGVPAQGERQQRLSESRRTTSRLGAFLEQRQSRVALPEGQYTLVDVENPEQLQPGVHVFHPMYGVGEIVSVVGGRIRASFGGRQKVFAPSPGLQIVGA